MTNENQDNIGRFYMQEDLTIAHQFNISQIISNFLDEQ